MTFETVTAQSQAHPNYSQIFLMIDRSGESIGRVVDLISDLGGELIGLDVFTGVDTRKILKIMVINDRVSDIVLGLIQEGHSEAIGYGRRGV